MKVIIYTNDAGKISVITPIDCGLTIEEIAEKDVPTVVGLNDVASPRQYLILDDSLLPDRNEREQWVFKNNKVVVDFDIVLPKAVRDMKLLQ